MPRSSKITVQEKSNILTRKSLADCKPPAAYRDYTTNGCFKSGGGSHGDIAASFKGRNNTMHEVIGRRLVQFGGDLGGEVWRPTCEDWAVLLPRYAPDACRDPRTLARLADLQRIPSQRDLAVIVNLRFERHELLHHIWKLARGFADQHFAVERQLPVVAALHVPALAGRTHLNHVHLIVSRRRLINTFADFCDDIAGQAGRALIGDLWAKWLAERG